VIVPTLMLVAMYTTVAARRPALMVRDLDP
jgi:hypothetical protein